MTKSSRKKFWRGVYLIDKCRIYMEDAFVVMNLLYPISPPTGTRTAENTLIYITTELNINIS